MFEALDKVSYDTLQLRNGNVKTTPNTKKKRVVKPLIDLTCTALNWHSPLLDEGICGLPVHLVPKLLQIAVANNQAWAVSTIIANWPTETLRFVDILSPTEAALFEEDMGVVCFYTFEGITSRTKHCKLQRLDFRGIQLNKPFYKLIIQTWPFLSLKKAQLKPRKLAKIITKAAGVEQHKLADDVTLKVLQERLGQDILRSPDSRINLPKGQRLEVLIDSVHFTTSCLFFMDYMIANCLRDYSPVYVTVTNIYIKSQLKEGDIITDTLAPFLVLKGQNVGTLEGLSLWEVEEGVYFIICSDVWRHRQLSCLDLRDCTCTLEGLSLRELEEGVFFIICSDVGRHRQLSCLDLHDCNLYLQPGITRSRTLQRTRLAQTFSCFTHLHRLDIGFNYLIGCLGELLDALTQPLDYLSLRGCDLNETDLLSLSKSKHAAHLRELNLSKLCQFSIYENDRISPTYLLKITKHFTNLTVLNLSQNHLPDSGIAEFCETITTHLCQLKALDVAGNILQFDNQLEIVRACAKMPKMQWVRFTCVNNMMNNGFLLENNPNQVGEMLTRFRDLLKSLGRNDICVDVVRLSFAILVDLIDIFD